MQLYKRKIKVNKGDKYGELTVLREEDSKIEKDGRAFRMVLCKCKCGNKKIIGLEYLRNGHSTSCGCIKRKNNITKGDVFGKLTVIKEDGVSKNISRLALCECECGNTTTTRISSLLRGITKSCGCLRKGAKRKVKHGKCESSEYAIWSQMKARCSNKKHQTFKYYGGRGITVCDRWIESFENFYKDMGDKKDGLSLDRINNNNGYSKENCRWATLNEQSNNRRSNIYVSINNVDISFQELADFFGLKKKILYHRIFTYNWDLKKALTTKKLR